MNISAFQLLFDAMYFMNIPQSVSRLPVYTAIFSALLISIAGCSKEKSASAPTQVVAKVNGAEISVHQLNAAMANVPGLTRETVDQARRTVLDKLVEQQLAVEQAVDQKLDRSPEVMMAMETAKRDILARAYLEKTISALPKVTTEEAQKYYKEHPQLFAQRRVFNLQEIVMPAQNAPVEKLRDMAGAKSMDEISNWLKQQNIAFSANATSRSSDQLPLDMVPKLHEMKDGQSAVFASPQAVSVIRIAASQAAPVDEATALPRIQQFLANQRASSEIAANIKQLKDKAKIEIVMANGETAKPAAPEPAAAAKPAPGNIEKGVAGLK
jgi:EpsD family peptidyl-prolyl cis-trans isomerase